MECMWPGGKPLEVPANGLCVHWREKNEKIGSRIRKRRRSILPAKSMSPMYILRRLPPLLLAYRSSGGMYFSVVENSSCGVEGRGEDQVKGQGWVSLAYFVF